MPVDDVYNHISDVGCESPCLSVYSLQWSTLERSHMGDKLKQTKLKQLYNRL